MTRALLLRLRGPLQAWGADSRFSDRGTHHAPTKSAVVGLLAAAEGRRRSDPVEDLAGLEFGVRVEHGGTTLRDYQTAFPWQAPAADAKTSLSSRHYLSDAHFLAAVSGPDALLEGLAGVLLRPRYPLYLGRRSCPVGPDLVVGVEEGDVEAALRAQPWKVPSAVRRTRPRVVHLPIYRDARPGEDVVERVRDIPLSFSQEHRQYAWREVHAPDPHRVENPEGLETADDFWEAVVGA